MINILIILLFNSTILFSNSKEVVSDTCFGKYEPMQLSTKPVTDTLIIFKEPENPILWAGGNQGNSIFEHTHYVCFKNNITQTIYLVDSLGRDLEFNETTSKDETGKEFWTENVNVEIIDSNSLLVYVENTLTLELYDENNPYKPIIIQEIKNINEINTEIISNKYYIAVFYDKNKQIVNIKRIKT